MPQTNDRVPSMGSSTQVKPDRALLDAIFLAVDAVVGEALLDQLADDPLARLVAFGHRVPIHWGLTSMAAFCRK